MKKTVYILIICLLLMGCTAAKPTVTEPPTEHTEPATTLSTEAGTIAESTINDYNTEKGPITIKVYIPNENLDGFLTTEVTGEDLTFMEAMVEAGILNQDIVVNSFQLSEDTLTVDFNSAFQDLIYTQGTTGEYMIIGSVVNTLIDLNNVTYVYITVEGDIWESGHVIYDFPLEFHE